MLTVTLKWICGIGLTIFYLTRLCSSRNPAWNQHQSFQSELLFCHNCAWKGHCWVWIYWIGWCHWEGFPRFLLWSRTWCLSLKCEPELCISGSRKLNCTASSYMSILGFMNMLKLSGGSWETLNLTLNKFNKSSRHYNHQGLRLISLFSWKCIKHFIDVFKICNPSNSSLFVFVSLKAQAID